MMYEPQHIAYSMPDDVTDIPATRAAYPHDLAIYTSPARLLHSLPVRCILSCILPAHLVCRLLRMHVVFLPQQLVVHEYDKSSLEITG